MRILHTADWHLGKTLEGRDRSQEQQRVMEEICDIADAEAVDLVLIAGDVYQTVNPPAWAENLFYETIHRLSQFGRRAVVVISGNHDNPERLRAANPLADKQGIYLIGLPKDQLQKSTSPQSGSVYTVDAHIGMLELAVPQCEHTAVLSLLPYPSESRLRELLSASPEMTDIREAYSERVGQWFATQSTFFRPDTVNVAMSHLFIQGGVESDSERQIQLGGAYTVEPERLPSKAQYIALGHLHRPQAVTNSGTTARYAGSPLAYSFSEAGQEKSVVIVEAEPNTPVSFRTIPLTAGRPLTRWVVKNGLAQLEQWCEEGRDVNAWIDLKIHLPHVLTHEEIQRIRKMRDGFVHIRPIFPATEQVAQALAQQSKKPEDLFRRFYYEQTDSEPREAVVQLFLQLLEDSQTDEKEEEVSANEASNARNHRSTQFS